MTRSYKINSKILISNTFSDKKDRKKQSRLEQKIIREKRMMFRQKIIQEKRIQSMTYYLDGINEKKQNEIKKPNRSNEKEELKELRSKLKELQLFTKSTEVEYTKKQYLLMLDDEDELIEFNNLSLICKK